MVLSSGKIPTLSLSSGALKYQPKQKRAGFIALPVSPNHLPLFDPYLNEVLPSLIVFVGTLAYLTLSNIYGRGGDPGSGWKRYGSTGPNILCFRPEWSLFTPYSRPKGLKNQTPWLYFLIFRESTFPPDLYFLPLDIEGSLCLQYFLITMSNSVSDQVTKISEYRCRILKGHRAINYPKVFEPDELNAFCATRILPIDSWSFLPKTHFWTFSARIWPKSAPV